MEVVENQFRSNDPPQTGRTLKRLQAARHSEKEAKRLVACVVSAEIFDVLKKQEPSNLEHFVKVLDKLPALAWEEEMRGSAAAPRARVSWHILAFNKWCCVQAAEPVMDAA